MDYSSIAVAKRALEAAGIPVPDTEEEIRGRAYECLANKDFLAAHSIRLGKNHNQFTCEDWVEVMIHSGEGAIRNNMVAFAACMRCGLLT